MAVQRGQVQTVGGMGESTSIFPNVYCLMTCIIVLKNDVSFHWMLVLMYTSQFVDHINVAYYIDNFLSGQDINQYAPFSVPENCSHNFSIQCLLLWSCNVMALQAWSFLFGIKESWKQLLSPFAIFIRKELHCALCPLLSSCDSSSRINAKKNLWSPRVIIISCAMISITLTFSSSLMSV